MALAFESGARYENQAGAFTVLEVTDGALRVLTDDGKIGHYTIANQQIHARPTRKPSPFTRKVIDPSVESVLATFRCMLDRKGWELYAQPHLNGLRPDLVALNPRVGMALYRTCDLDSTALAMPGVAEDLVSTLVRYKQEVLGLYCPRLGVKVAEEPDAVAVVTTGLILTRVSTAEAQSLLRPALEAARLLGSAMRYAPICGQDILKTADTEALLPSARYAGSRYMTADLANDLRAWLYEPDHVATSRIPLELNDQQKQLARKRTASGYRRIKGPAGSGKSQVVAARAAELALQGKAVLVVSFNITLLQYLRSLAMRYPAPGVGLTNRVTWLHFHDWCKRVCHSTGFQREYRSLWVSDDGDNPDLVLEMQLPRLVERALAAAPDRAPTYDAILVDEGQDFNLGWWNVLRKVLRPNGEMLLVADETQDVYGRARAWTDQAMLGAGFRGDWARLSASYRLPGPLVPHVRRFAEQFLRDEEVNFPERAQQELGLEPARLRWLQVDPRDALRATVQAVKDSPIFAAPQSLTYSDVTLLVDSHQFGAACVELVQAAGMRVAHIFAKDSREQRSRKLAFQMGTATVKACTVHSFKGWETRSLVVTINQARSVRDRALVYVALSRLKRHPQGSFLTVVCSAPELEAYGQSWPEFNRVTCTLAEEEPTTRNAIPEEFAF